VLGCCISAKIPCVIPFAGLHRIRGVALPETSQQIKAAGMQEHKLILTNPKSSAAAAGGAKRRPHILAPGDCAR
jgi:hypothetical protein